MGKRPGADFLQERTEGTEWTGTEEPTGRFSVTQKPTSEKVGLTLVLVGPGCTRPHLSRVGRSDPWREYAVMRDPIVRTTGAEFEFSDARPKVVTKSSAESSSLLNRRIGPDF